MELTFACELDDDKAAWLQAAHPECNLIFRNVAELSRHRAWNRVSRDYDLVPPVDLWVAGFVCTDKSKLNRNSAANIDCIRNNTGASGTTFHYALAYLKACQPAAFLLENVKELRNKKGAEFGDLEFCIQELEAIRNSVSCQSYSACEHGSPAERVRCYIRGFMGAAQAKLQHCHAIASMVKIGRLPQTLFLGGDSFSDFEQINIDPIVKGGCRVADPDWGDKHLEAFREAQLAYPPNFEDFPDAFSRAVLPLEGREREVAAYAELTLPWPDKLGVVQFFDINQSLQWLVGNSGSNFFSEHCQTIAGSSRIWAGVQLSEAEKRWALLPGSVLMKMTGYPGTPHQSTNSSLMSSLAGNAFNAFSLGPILMGYCSVAKNSHAA